MKKFETKHRKWESFQVPKTLNDNSTIHENLSFDDWDSKNFVNLKENAELGALDKRIENLKKKILKSNNSNKSKKIFKKPCIKPKFFQENAASYNKKNLEVSRIGLFINSEDYLRDFLDIIKKHCYANHNFSEDIEKLNDSFIHNNKCEF